MERKFDNILFTGSVNVACHVARALAKLLMPTVLDLGGQCPAIVTKTADIEHAAKNIAWAKYLNLGRTCLSLNRVSAHPAVQEKLVKQRTFCYIKSNKEGSTDCVTHIINKKNFNALKELPQKSHQEKIEDGGELNASRNWITLSGVSDVQMTGRFLSQPVYSSKRLTVARFPAV